MSSEKIPTITKSVGLTLACIIGLPILWWYCLDFPMDTMSDESRRKFAQIGLVINLVAGLSMVVRYLWLNSYKRRLKRLYQIDDLMVAKYELLKHHTFDKATKDQAEAQFKLEQKPLYEELQNYLKFDKVESVHMFIGLAGLCVGTVFQMIAAG
ncbi:hypothetical protein [Vibrio coralliirubri]|uniref:hypothetical protein n=1 Tax=Vibrio coralliirubri TaxID=1516159 RepID=UPI002FE3781E